jgi:single-stranded-DNA-specific exonuclease
MLQKRWTIAEPHAQAQALAARLRCSPVVAQILASRGFTDSDAAREFLSPSLKLLHDPHTIPGLSRAAERIARAIVDRDKIVVYGDYDVDGITATSILWHAIKRLGGVVEYYIPHRIEEGYGLNADAVAEICDGGAKLIITVDCGVTAIDPVKVAVERGVDVIVTDHHEWKEVEDRGSRIEDRKGEDAVSLRSSILHPRSSLSPCVPLLPAAYAVVHPRLPVEGVTPYGNPNLCGAGVAFKLAWGIGQAIGGGGRVTEDYKDFLVNATAFAALGTIADVVPLVGENRILAAFGLGGLKSSKLQGIRALIESAQLTGQKLDAFHVGFLLAPRLNASGRMGHARLAVEMMTDASATRATEIADYLEQQNKERQAIERQIVDAAVVQVKEQKLDADDNCAIVLGGEGWHPGVIGIVASRIVDKFHRPAVMVALANGHGSGSCRSIPGFHLAKALTACGEHLISYGGHEMAAGLKVETAKFNAFREAFCAHAKQAISPELLLPELKLDVEADLRSVDMGLVSDLARLGPFGHGNRKPLLACRDVEIAQPPRRVGKNGDHLQLTFKQAGKFMKGIAFGMGTLADHLRVGDTVEIAVEPTVNEFNGYTNVELMVKDLRVKSASRA